MSLNDETYTALIPQALALLEGEPSLVANLANISAVLKQATDWHWVGFYLVDFDRDELALGPFQGPVACTRLRAPRMPFEAHLKFCESYRIR